MAPKHSKLVSLIAAALLVLFVAPACAKEDKAQKAPPASSAASATSAQGTVEGPTTAAGKPETVVFEVTGTGTALTIDTDPAGPDRLYDVPLPWTSTVSVPAGTTLLQVVVVGKGETSPGCKITLDGKVVAEKPEGGDAHCILQPN